MVDPIWWSKNKMSSKKKKFVNVSYVKFIVRFKLMYFLFDAQFLKKKLMNIQ